MASSWDDVIRSWEPLRPESAAALGEARLLAHWAAQVVAAVGATEAAGRSDDSHTSMSWLETTRFLAGVPLTSGTRAALHVERLSLAVLGRDGDIVATLPLAGRTLDEAMSWMARKLAGAGGAGSALSRPGYDMPDHAVGSGAPFGDAGRDALAELARWFANAARVAGAIADGCDKASPVRCWPHHFDIATLVALDDSGDPETARSIGAGLSPGDESYGEPYFYVNPWPRPDASVEGPPLEGGGLWHKEGFFGAVLPASRVGEDQAARVAAFSRSAVRGCRRLLGA